MATINHPNITPGERDVINGLEHGPGREAAIEKAASSEGNTPADVLMQVFKDAGGGWGGGGTPTPTPTPTPVPEPPPLEEGDEEPAATPPATTPPPGISADQLQAILVSYGLDPAVFDDLIRQAIAGQWSTPVLLAKIFQDPLFTQQFPGISFLISQGLPASQALDQWRQLKHAYTQAVLDQGASNIINVDNLLVGLAIQNGKSPEEFGALVKGVKMFHDDPGFADFLNEIVSQANLQPLSQTGVIEFLAGLAEPEVYDTYEAYHASQVGMDSATARQFARALGVAGQQTDLRALPEALMAFDAAAGQELRMAGFTKDDMVLVATRDQLSGEFRERADKLAIAFEQAFENRAARSAPRPQGQVVTVAGRPVSGEAPALASIG